MDLPVYDCPINFLRDKHIKFCIRCLAILPQICEFLDANRLPVAFFAISGLDLLGAISKLDKEKQDIIEWLYFLQIRPDDNNEADCYGCGFRGSTTCSVEIKNEVCDKAHIASTYTALCCLVILGDDLSRVDKRNIIHSVRKLQLPNGSFRALHDECESDIRHLYCAACICYILQDWSGMDVEKAVDFIQKSVNYDGGIGQGAGLESHAGFTFCAVAALYLMGKLDVAFTPKQMKSLKRWLVFLQCEGFHGRPNKPDDSCYSFWVGATLKILNCYDFVNYPELLTFVLSTQDSIVGGIGKYAEVVPDMLHTYLGISGLSLKNEKLTTSVFPALNISQRAAEHLFKLHKEWDVAR